MMKKFFAHIIIIMSIALFVILVVDQINPVRDLVDHQITKVALICYVVICGGFGFYCALKNRR